MGNPNPIPPLSSSSTLYLSCSAIIRLCLVAIMLTHQMRVNSGALLLGLKHQLLQRKHQAKLSPEIQGNQTQNEFGFGNGNGNGNGNGKQCNMFVGSWVPDDSYPIYEYSDCPLIETEFNCRVNGRPDSGYLRYRWRPDACELPRFNGEKFVEGMRGRTVMFVGDSLGRNQWESLICIISSAIPSSSPTHIIRDYPLLSFKLLEYELTISYYKAPYLVDIDIVRGKRVLKLDDISGNGNSWQGVDVLLFNTGHWWTHDGSLEGWDYIESGGKLYQDMDRLTAMEQGLKTWARWIDTNVDATSTRVFFLSISPSHYNPTSGTTAEVTPARTCYGETAPTNGITYPANGYPPEYADQMKVLDTVLGEMSVPTYLLDITMLSDMRKDCHPSIYTGNLSPGQRANPDRFSDCSHWCLPGLPDTWNQLFYTALFY